MNISNFYNAKERYVLSNDKLEALNHFSNSYEKKCYEILYLQTFVKDSCARQKELLNELNIQMLYGYRELVESLRTRYYLLLQGTEPELLPQVSDFLLKKLNIHFNAQKPSISNKAMNEVHYPSSLSDEKLNTLLTSNIFNESIREDSVYYFMRIINSIQDKKKIAKVLLEKARMVGMPGVVDTILVYLSTVDKLSTANFYLHLLSIDNMNELRRRVMDAYGYDLLTDASFVNQFMIQFGDDSFEDDSDPRVAELVEATLKRRIQFILENNLPGLANELKKLLDNQSKRGIYDKLMFIEYIRLLAAMMDHGRLCMIPKPLNAFTRNFLEHLFPHEKPDSFTAYLNPKEVKKLYESSLLMHGYDIKPQSLSVTEESELRERITCTLHPSNPLYYNVKDEVNVKVELKNVQHLEIRVFEVNTLAYFRANDKPIASSIDVDGLVPLFTESHEYSHAPILTHVETFAFPQIQHRGVYIVDFVSNRQNCRYVIKKGCLNVLQRPCLDGIALTIVDELGNRVEENVKVLMEEREFTLNEEKEIIIPYLPPSDHSRTVSVLVCQMTDVNWFFVKKHSLLLTPEKIRLSITGSVDTEAAVPGNEDCTMLLRVTAELNDEEYPVEWLKNLTVTLHFTDEHDIQSEKILHPVLDNTRCFSYTCRVQEGYSEISVSASADVITNNDKEEHIISESFTLFCNNSKQHTPPADTHAIEQTLKLFRKKVDNKVVYVLQAYGPASECLPYQPYTLEFKNRLCDTPIKVQLETDQNGQIQLGSLDRISYFSIKNERFDVVHDTFDIQTTWTVSDCESIQAQFPVTAEDVQQYTLICKSCIYDFSAVQPVIGYVDGMLRVSNLPAGHYVFNLYLKNLDSYAISITVKRSSAKPTIYNGLYFYGKGVHSIPLTPLTMTCAFDANRLNVAVRGGTGRSSVHILCKTFVSNESIKDFLSNSLSSLSYQKDLNVDSSILAGGRVLSDEYAYIMERQKRERALPGSMLPPPSLLLNPVENDSTTTENIKGREGVDCFDNINGYGQPAYKACCAYSRPVDLQVAMDMKGSIDSILHPSVLMMDIPMDQDGKGSVELPTLTGCGYEVYVLCEDVYEVIDRHLYYDQPSEAKTVTQLLKNQSLQEGLDITKHFTEEQTIVTAKEGEVVRLETNRDFVALTCLEDVWLLLKTLSDNDALLEFSFLLKWGSLSEEDKQMYYNRYNCSEVNCFVYFKDPAFFQAIVKPNLESKLEKSFLDHFFVGDDVSEFLLPNRFERLNEFEKALLFSRLDKRTSKKMVNGMKQAALFKKMSQEELSKITETALKLKSMNQKETKEEEESDTASQEMEESEMGSICCYCEPGCSSLSPGYIPASPVYAPISPACGPFDEGSPIRQTVKRGRKRREPAPAVPSLAYYAPREKLYEKLEKTKEYVEGYYYQSKRMYSSPSIVPLSPFWSAFADFLLHPSDCFLSPDFIYCTHSFSEVILCLAVMGLSYDEVAFKLIPKDNHFEFVSPAPSILFQKVIKETEKLNVDSRLIITQKYIDCNNEYEIQNGKKVERYMPSNEFLIGQPYICKICMTNLSTSEISTSVLYQIPVGSFPLFSPYTSHTHHCTIAPYSTEVFTYYFYFPYVGEYAHFPAHLMDASSSIIGYAPVLFQPLHVVDKIEIVDITSWRDVAFTADEEAVFYYLSSHDITSIDWNLIEWRLSDVNFFLELTAFLRSYGYFQSSIWSWGILHKDVQTTKEYLSKHLVKSVGLYFESPLLTLRPDEEDLFRVREYKPFINNRCLTLGKRMKISNDKLEAQYQKFLDYLMMKQPTTDDYALMTYYLILQDRISDAFQLFTQKVCDEVDGQMVRKPDCTCAVQCDYMIAYFACFHEGLAQARQLCEQYKDYPVIYWREMFSNIADLIKDYDSVPVIEERVPQNMQNVPANVIRSKRTSSSVDASLTIEVHDEKVRLTTVRVSSVSVNLYELNAELMFSKEPFLQNNSSTSLFIRPNYSEVVELKGDLEEILVTEYTLPEVYQTKNVLVEVVHGNLRETAFAFNNHLLVLLSSKSGQLRVYDKNTQKPLPLTYVKVYAKTNSGTEFLKDGYTDIRGYFDYFSVSTDVGDRCTLLSLFIDKEGYGSCIREVKPPVSASK